jgi:hypothetical protein
MHACNARRADDDRAVGERERSPDPERCGSDSSVDGSAASTSDRARADRATRFQDVDGHHGF